MTAGVSPMAPDMPNSILIAITTYAHPILAVLSGYLSSSFPNKFKKAQEHNFEWYLRHPPFWDTGSTHLAILCFVPRLIKDFF